MRPLRVLVLEHRDMTPPADVKAPPKGAKKTKSGLAYNVITKGKGKKPKATDRVEVHYTGWLYDEEAEGNRGAKFDSSVDRGQKFQFTLGANQVIKGWDQGVAGMLIGEKRELTLAPEMGYGDRGAGNVIPPGATLVFEVELFGAEGPSDSQ